jgi:hypothetical protein
VKYFYDTEFYEDGKQIHLISIGIVAEDNRTLYLENKDFNWGIVPDEHWLWENVYPHLTHDRTPKREIANLVRRFITMDQSEFKNQIWAYYGSYDHVVMAQLFGKMVDMPDGVPWFTMDVKQAQIMLGAGELPLQDGVEHHALADAWWTKKAHDYLMYG